MIGAILAGGQSRRMGGGDKTLSILHGQPILRHILNRLSPQVERVILNANGDTGRFASFGLEVVADDLSGYQGPLAGLLAVVDRYAEEAALVTVSCDTPFLPLDLVSRFESVFDGIHPVAARSSGGHHPLIGIWPMACRAQLRDDLTHSTERRVMTFARQVEMQWLDFPDQDLADGRRVDPFFNINTPESLNEAEKFPTADLP